MTQRVVWWTQAGWAARQRLARGIGLVVAVVLSLGPRPAFAQSGQVQVSYDVEFSTTGALLSGPGVCTAAVGFDKLSGTIMGFEPAPAHEDNIYSGDLIRDTNVTFCYTGTHPNKPDQAYNCIVKITGKARRWSSTSTRTAAVGTSGRWIRTSRLLRAPLRVPAIQRRWPSGRPTMARCRPREAQMVSRSTLSPSRAPGRFQKRSPQVARRDVRHLEQVPRAPRQEELGIWTLKVSGRRP